MVTKKRKIAEEGREGAIRAAVSILAYKENTERELYDKLVDRGCTREDAREAVHFAVGKNYLCESRYFARFAENCAQSRLYGRQRILMEARRKGFSEKTLSGADAVLDDIDFCEVCYKALKKCSLPTAEKATASLLRKGFALGEIKAALAKFREESGAAFGAAKETIED